MKIFLRISYKFILVLIYQYYFNLFKCINGLVRFLKEYKLFLKLKKNPNFTIR